MGEGRELYNKAVEAEDMSIYLKGMQDTEDAVVKADAKKFFSGDEDIVRARLRRSQEKQAHEEHEKFLEKEERGNNPQKAFETDYSEAMAIENMANKAALKERGSSAKPTSDEYQKALDTLNRIGLDEKYSDPEKNSFLLTQNEVMVKHLAENEQRALITEDIKELIMEVAKSKFSEFLDQYIAAKSAEKESKRKTSMLVVPEISKFYNDFKEGVTGDPRLSALTGENENLKTAINTWSQRFYEKELNDYLEREMGADNYSI